MKSRLICLVLAFSLIFSYAMPKNMANAADGNTISFHVQYGQTDARKMADMVNEFRTQNGKAAMSYDYNLEKVAMQRAAEIAVRYNKIDEEVTHYRPDGNTYKSTIAEFGFDVSPRGILYGENILFGTQDSMKLDGAFGKFSSDEDNSAQMLGNYTIFGIGHVKIEEKTDFWVQVFATKGTPGAYTSPVDGDTIVSVKVDPSIVSNISVDYVSGDSTVATGNTVPVPVYIAKIRVTGSEMEDALELAPLSFESNDGYVYASGGYMTGLQQGSGNISVNLLGQTYSYGVTVTEGNGSGNNVIIPTLTPSTDPTQAPTSAPVVPTSAPEVPTSAPVVPTSAPVVPTSAPVVPTSAPVVPTSAPVVPTSAPVVPTSAPEVPTSAPVVPTSAPEVPTSLPTTAPTQSPTSTVTPTQAPSTDAGSNTDTTSTSLKKGDTFSEGGLKYKVTASGKVAVVGLVSKTTTTITIPNTVKHLNAKYSVVSISASAFAKKTKLKSVSIGKNVTSIGKKAFYGCSKLTTVTILGSKVKKVGSKAFAKINKKAIISVPSASYKSYKKLLDKSGINSTVKKV